MAPHTASELLDAAQLRRLPLPDRGVEIALLDWGGDGPLALLHHANGFCKGTLALVAAPLRPHFRVVAMDARGHGDSTPGSGDDPYAWAAFAGDIAAAARIAQARGAMLAVDSTVATPVLTRPIEQGADLVMHSATKYLNGHSDVIAGAIVADGERIERCLATLARIGCCIDPQAAWLLQRGLRTLPVRWARHCANAAVLAPRLRDHPAVGTVHWPGFEPEVLATAPLHDAGAMLAFELADADAADRMLARVRLCTHAVSLGGLETLVCTPRQTSHTQFTPEARRARGIADGLVRISVGLEDPDDVWADLEQALAG